MSEFNIEEYINSLPEDVEEINVSFDNLTYLPDLSRFTNLKELYCGYNQLTSLPNLPANLQELYCSKNQLTLLPNLPPNLQTLICSYNQLTLLPNLPPKLQTLGCDNNQLTLLPDLPTTIKYLYYNNNPIYDLLNSDDISVIRNKLKILNKFRDLYYCIKYKSKFRKWLWDLREKKIQENFHPDKLREMLEGKDIDDVDFE